jgi:hypothetical protein
VIAIFGPLPVVFIGSQRLIEISYRDFLALYGAHYSGGRMVRKADGLRHDQTLVQGVGSEWARD